MLYHEVHPSLSRIFLQDTQTGASTVFTLGDNGGRDEGVRGTSCSVLRRKERVTRRRVLLVRLRCWWFSFVLLRGWDVAVRVGKPGRGRAVCRADLGRRSRDSVTSVRELGTRDSWDGAGAGTCDDVLNTEVVGRVVAVTIWRISAVREALGQEQRVNAKIGALHFDHR